MNETKNRIDVSIYIKVREEALPDPYLRKLYTVGMETFSKQNLSLIFPDVLRGNCYMLMFLLCDVILNEIRFEIEPNTTVINLNEYVQAPGELPKILFIDDTNKEGYLRMVSPEFFNGPSVDYIDFKKKFKAIRGGKK